MGRFNKLYGSEWPGTSTQKTSKPKTSKPKTSKQQPEAPPVSEASAPEGEGE